MRLTIVHPCVGRRRGTEYLRTWQMQPLAPATLAGLTPEGVHIRFYDDRLEPIPYNEETDLVAISVETYTARRAYQIASEYRRRGVPVVMGGFHPSLVAEEAGRYAETVVIGEAEGLWPRVVDDYARGRAQRIYKQPTRPSLAGLKPNRSIFEGKRYLPVGLIEAGRGCKFKCEFCAVQTYFGAAQTMRPVEEIVEEVREHRSKLVFFVDDNMASQPERIKELYRALIPLKIRWVSQVSITAAHDEEMLRLMRDSGCQAVLIGFESLDPKNLRRMGKGFNTMKGGFEVAMANMRRYGIRIYATFLVGYDEDQPDSIYQVLEFCRRHRFYIVAFNHVTPFPGTPLYDRLVREGRMLFDRWWLDPDYRYGMVPFTPRSMTAGQVHDRCMMARKRFYSLPSILRRGLDFEVNGNNWFMWRNYFPINLLFRAEVSMRNGYPLGDESFEGPLVPVDSGSASDRLITEIASAGAN